jgi:ribonuclease HI
MIKKQERLKVRKSENKTKRQSQRGATKAASKNVEAVKAVETSTDAIPEVKVEEVKTEEPKEETATVEVKAEEAAPKTTRAKKEPKAPRKPRTPKADKASKAAATEEKPKRAYTRRNTQASQSVTLQFDGRDVSLNNLIDRVKAAYVAEGHKEASIKNVEVYVKPSENMAYYVIDGYASGINLY